MINIKQIIKPLLLFCNPDRFSYDDRVARALGLASEQQPLNFEAISPDEFNELRGQLLFLTLIPPVIPQSPTEIETHLIKVLSKVLVGLADAKSLYDEAVVRFAIPNHAVAVVPAEIDQVLSRPILPKVVEQDDSLSSLSNSVVRLGLRVPPIDWSILVHCSLWKANKSVRDCENTHFKTLGLN